MMEINPADKQILGLHEQLYFKAPRPSENNNKSQSADSAAFDKSFEGYVAKALSASAGESVDIEQIRKEMNAGQYDSPEAIVQAAQTILARGI